MNVSDNNPNQQFQQQSQQQQQPSTPQPTSLQQFHAVNSDFTHQTFQRWLDLLVDANSNDEVKLKAITDLSLNLEVRVEANYLSLSWLYNIINLK